MRYLRPDLLSCLFLALSLGAASAATANTFGQRTVVADMMRLSGYATGPVSAAGPGLDVAVGIAGAPALGAQGCDTSDMTYRELVRPRVNLTITSPGAKRLDLIIRTVHEGREIAVQLDGDTLGSRELTGGWQRISFRTQPLSEKPHRLSFTMTPNGTRVTGNAGPRALAWLHSVRVSTQLRPPEGDVASTFRGTGTLWLEAGETLRIPTLPLAEHALQTDGLSRRGDHSDLVMSAAVESREGAINTLISMPASLTLPWNLNLAPKGARAAMYIRLSVSGESQGAIGLTRPVLTVAGAPASSAPLTPAKRLVLITVPGMRFDDSVVGLKAVPGARVSRVWSTAATTPSALASLLTGHYASRHQLTKRGDRLVPSLATLARDAETAGFKTLLRTGHIPNVGKDGLWAYYGDKAFAATGGFPHTAEHVLGVTMSALEKAGDAPIFATVVLSDVTAPYLPRRDAWTAHWPADAKPPWDARNGRKVLQAQRAKRRPPSDEEQSYWRALRRGKVDEIVAALGTFIEAVKRLPGDDIQVIVVGLAGQGPLAAGTPPTPRDLAAPLVMVGTERPPTPEGPADLTDVHATCRALMQLPVGSGPGHRFDIREGPGWSDAAYANIANRWDVMVAPPTALVGDRITGVITRLSSDTTHGDGLQWTPHPSPGDGTIEGTLRLNRFQAFQSAGERWSRAHYGVASATDRPDGQGGMCDR